MTAEVRYIPSNHLGVVIDRDVGKDAFVIGSKVAVWRTEELVKTMLQRQVLSSVSEVPGVRYRLGVIRNYWCIFIHQV